MRMTRLPENVIEDPMLRDRELVFRDRRHAGDVLAGLVNTLGLKRPVVLAIPAGGVPVGIEVARALGAELDLIIARKLQIPGNTEAGFGAVAEDGPVFLNDGLVESLGLTRQEIKAAEEKTREELKRRVLVFRAGRPMPELHGREVLLVDDGLASGATMIAALAWAKDRGPDQVIVAAPTGHESTALRLSRQASFVVCPNIRGGLSFAVASAYQHWHDLADTEVMAALVEPDGKK